MKNLTRAFLATSSFVFLSGGIVFAQTAAAPPAASEAISESGETALGSFVSGPSAGGTLAQRMRRLENNFKGLKKTIDIRFRSLEKKIANLQIPPPPPPPPWPSVQGPIPGVSEEECKSAKWSSKGALWSSEYNSCYYSPFCPLAAASASYPIPCPPGNHREYSQVKFPPWECGNFSFGRCVPDTPTPLSCAAGYELRRGDLCYNPLASLVYFVSDKDARNALPLNIFAPPNLGVSRTCSTGDNLVLSQNGTALNCEGGSGIVTPPGQWNEIQWGAAGLKSYVDPATAQSVIDAGKVIIQGGCPTAKSTSEVNWNPQGVPISCKTGSGTGGTTGASLPENWSACLKIKGVAAGSTQIKIDSALAEINGAIAARRPVNYSAIDSTLYNPIAECDRSTGVYLSSLTGGGSGTTTGSWTTPGTGCGQYDTNESQCRAASGCEWKIPSGSSDGRYYCMSTSYASGGGTASSGQCPPFAHDMYNGTCMSNGDNGSCAPYAEKDNESNYNTSKCSTAGTGTGGGTTTGGCPSGQYWNGSSCVTSTGGSGTDQTSCSQGGGTWNASTNSCTWPGGGTASGGTTSFCSEALKALLGDGCHYMYPETYCDGSMTKSAKTGDTTTRSGCSSTASLPPSTLIGQLLTALRGLFFGY